MTYLRNCWYVAGHAHEVTDQPLGRMYLDEPVVIYRDQHGALVALDDRCPHRMAPLSRGKVVEGAIQCPYHGLRFDASGACVHLPAGGQAPPRATLKSFPVVERHSLIWIWMGAANLADPALIPDYSDRDNDQYAWFTGVLHCRANYQLLVDNLLDLSHAEFLHPLLASPGWAARNRQTITQQDRSMHVVNTAENDNILPINKLFKPSLGPIGTNVLTETWDAPSMVRLSSDYFCNDDFILVPSAHMLTPETEYSTHYFVRGGQAVAIDNPEVTKAMEQGVLHVFRTEDIPLIEAQQRNLGTQELMEHDPAILSTDLAPVRARRLLAKLIRAEQQQPSRPAAAAE